MDDQEWQRDVSTKLGSILAELKRLDVIDLALRNQNGRIDTLERDYQQRRGVLAMLGIMGFTGVLAFLGWLAKLAGLVRP